MAELQLQEYRVKIMAEDELAWSVVVIAYNRPQALAAAMNAYKDMLRAEDLEEGEAVEAGLDLLCNEQGEGIFIIGKPVIK